MVYTKWCLQNGVYKIDGGECCQKVSQYTARINPQSPFLNLYSNRMNYASAEFPAWAERLSLAAAACGVTRKDFGICLPADEKLKSIWVGKTMGKTILPYSSLS